MSDDPDNHEVTPPSDYDRVGQLKYLGGAGSSAVLIDPWHILTACHTLSHGQPSDYEFVLHLEDGAHTFQITQRFLHSESEVAVGRLDRSTGLVGYPLYRQAGEVGEEGILVGYGVSGTGWSGPDEANYPRGTKRYGYNRLNLIQGEYILMDFDGPTVPGPLPPGTLGMDKEVMLAAGDSGGPTFLEEGGQLYIAGLHYAVTVSYGDPNYLDFGDVGYDVRVSMFADWIDDQIADYKTLDLTVINTDLDRIEMAPTPTDPNAPEFPEGTEVTLTAITGGGKEFEYWVVYDPNHPGDANFAQADANLTITVLMDTHREVEAYFKCGSVPASGLLLLSLGIGLVALAKRRLSLL